MSDDDCRKMFKMCVDKTTAGQEVKDNTKCKSGAMNKLMKECFDPKTANQVDATIFPRLCDKTTKMLTFDVFMSDLLPAIAQMRVIDQHKATNPALTDPVVVQEVDNMKARIAAKYHEWISQEKGKNMAVVDRLTDVKGYTGAHKSRFDAETGKGKGIEGRMDRHDNTGYVGNYKGAGTFDKKH